MPHNASITAIILTYNEEMHIARCIGSLREVCEEILVVDSFSTDRTAEIARGMGSKVVCHEFVNQARQFNWAIANCDIRSEWIWRVDADEYISRELGREVCLRIAALDTEADGGQVNGIYVNKKIVFQGRPLLHGGWYPAPQIKIIRRGHGASENKAMDEHLTVFGGKTIYVDGDQTDENLNSLTWWTEKHNRYATREAANMMLMAMGMDGGGNEVRPRLWGNDSERKRWLKMCYARMPLFVRPFCNFIVRYILKGGFLDRNLTWYILQGFWYRYLVDAKIYELKKRLDFDKERIKAYLAGRYTADGSGR